MQTPTPRRSNRLAQKATPSQVTLKPTTSVPTAPIMKKPDTKHVSICVVPHNQRIYQLLMNKAEHEKQKAADYKAVAEALLTWDDNLVVRYYDMRDDITTFIIDEYPLEGCTSEIACFIEEQLDLLTSKNVCTRCTPKDQAPRCYCDNPPY